MKDTDSKEKTTRKGASKTDQFWTFSKSFPGKSERRESKTNLPSERKTTSDHDHQEHDDHGEELKEEDATFWSKSVRHIKRFVK